MEQVDSFARELNREYPGTGIFLGEPMRRHTTFRIGGTVSLYAQPKSLDAFVWAVRELRRRGTEFMVLGNGSNVLFSDEPHKLVVLGTERLDTVRVSLDSMICGAGVMLSRAASAALEAGLVGCSHCGAADYLIPFTVMSPYQTLDDDDEL